MSDFPTASYDGTLERTTAGGVIRFERHLPYSIRDVWDAITNPARLAEWWLPFEADVTVDLQEGGRIVFVPRDDKRTPITCKILRVEPPMLLEHTHVDAASYMRWEIAPVDTGSVLRLSHFVTDTAGAIDRSYVAGLHTSLARLAPCLSGRPVEWDWDGFAEAQAHYAGVGFAPHTNSYKEET